MLPKSTEEQSIGCMKRAGNAKQFHPIARAEMLIITNPKPVEEETKPADLFMSYFSPIQRLHGPAGVDIQPAHVLVARHLAQHGAALTDGDGQRT